MGSLGISVKDGGIGRELVFGDVGDHPVGSSKKWENDPFEDRTWIFCTMALWYFRDDGTNAVWF